jgi:PhnB protein
MTVDLFAILLAPTEPISPDASFAQSLRERLVRALGASDIVLPAPAVLPTPPSTSGLSKGTAMPRTLPGHSAVTAYITCRGAADAIAFYIDIFGAVEDGSRYVDDSDGRLGHAEFLIGDTRMMISDEYPDYGAVSPQSLGGSPVMFTVYVDDVDDCYARAVSAGSKGLRPPEDQPYGARMGAILDPWGHRWSIQTITDGIERQIDGFTMEQH